MYRFALVVVFIAVVVPARATVITTGDVSPGGAATQPDPWTVGGDLTVGYFGDGTLNVEAGGLVSNIEGRIGYESGSSGTATVTGAGSEWNSSGYLYIGGKSYSSGGSGTLNLTDSGLTTGSFDNSEGGTFNMLDGLLRTDSVIGDITIQGGIFAPGHSPAVASITGDYTQGADAALEIELLGTAAWTAPWTCYLWRPTPILPRAVRPMILSSSPSLIAVVLIARSNTMDPR